jgi:4-hydroxyphenylpyruvate dioxygenase
MRIDQLAINSVSTTQKGLIEALDAYGAAGFRAVEFVIPQIKSWLAEGNSVADARRALTDRGLRSIGGFETHIACFGDAGARRVNHDLLRANCQLIHDLGGGTMVVGTDGPATPSVAALTSVADTLREFASTIDGLNVNVALEFNWSPLVRSLRSATMVAEMVDHPQVGVLFDLAHFYVTPSKLEHLTAESVRRIKHVHMDDMANKPGDLCNCNDDRVLPGTGILDVAGIIARLEEHGYGGYYAIEMFNAELWDLPAAEAAKLCYQSLLPFCC